MDRILAALVVGSHCAVLCGWVSSSWHCRAFFFTTSQLDTSDPEAEGIVILNVGNSEDVRATISRATRWLFWHYLTLKMNTSQCLKCRSEITKMCVSSTEITKMCVSSTEITKMCVSSTEITKIPSLNYVTVVYECNLTFRNRASYVVQSKSNA
jgi:hypothetical protein